MFHVYFVTQYKQREFIRFFFYINLRYKDYIIHLLLLQNNCFILYEQFYFLKTKSI